MNGSTLLRLTHSHTHAICRTYPSDIDHLELSKRGGPLEKYLKNNKKSPTSYSIDPLQQQCNPFDQRFSRLSEVVAFKKKVEDAATPRTDDESDDEYVKRIRDAVGKAYKDRKVEVPVKGIPSSAWNASSFGSFVSCLSQVSVVSLPSNRTIHLTHNTNTFSLYRRCV